MSYYFPLGGNSAITVQNASHSLLATTASAASASSIVAEFAIYAITSGSKPAAGTTGMAIPAESCSAAAPVGPQGERGPSGSKGSDLSVCPAGTIECPQLTLSMSSAFTGYDLTYYPNGINGVLPSGSQFTIVCIELGGCTTAQVVCPPSLSLASFPTFT